MVTNPDVFPYIKGIHLKKLPIKNVSEEIQQKFVGIVDEILDGNSTDKEMELKRTIDKLTYEIYELPPESIELIEQFHE